MAGQCFAHGAQHIPQAHGGTCWASCVAMLVNHRDGSTYTSQIHPNVARSVTRSASNIAFP